MENNEYNFLFLMNKCVLLFNYIDIYYQKEVLTDIKYFIKRLCDIYETKKFNSVHDKKYSVLNVLNKYLTKIIDEKIIFLVDNQDDNFITTNWILEKNILTGIDSIKNNIIKVNKYEK